MSKSISFQHGTKLSREHNVRNSKYTDKQEHIDKDRKDQNIIFIDRDLKEVYKEIFEEEFAKHNAKQRKDRQCNSYYEKIQNDKKRNLVYECIVQIGNEKDTSYTSELEKQALIKYAEDWEKRNPNLRLVGMYMHNDEATSHLHIDYIPVSTQNKRGMRIQNSLSGALKEQGFADKNINSTAEMSWQNSERLALEKICVSMGIDAKANQGLCKTKYYDEKTQTVKVGNRMHLSTYEYKKARQEMLSIVKAEKKQLEKEVATLNNEIKRRTSVLNQEVEVPTMPETIVVKGAFCREKTRNLTEEERKIKQQEIDNIKKQNELVQQQTLLRERELIIQEQEEKQKERFQKQNIELETLQKEITNLEHKKAQIIEDTEKIVKDKVNNALDNLDELKIYYEQAHKSREIYTKHFSLSENKPKESLKESEEKYGNKNVKNGYDVEL